MSKKNYRLAVGTVMALVAAGGIASAQHVRVFDGRTGAHGAGGGGGAGKVSVHDISISKSANAIIAFQPSFQGGVFVSAGDLNGDGKAMLQRAASRNDDPPQVIQSIMMTVLPAAGATQGRGVFILSTDKLPRSQSQNNLKQLGLAIHAATSVKISLLQDAGPGKKKHRMTYKLLQPKIAKNADGTYVLRFRGAEVAANTDTFYGKGVYKTTDGGQTWIGLLLPAVQKVR